MPDPIAFTGQIWKVQTLSGGGFRVTIDGTSQDIVQAALLMPFADTTGILVDVMIKQAQRAENEQESRAISRTMAKRRNV